jgi:hypothetical protein
MTTATLIASRITKGGKKYPFMVFKKEGAGEIEFGENMKLDGFVEEFKKASRMVDGMYLKPATMYGNQVWFASDSIGNPTALYEIK